MQHHLANAGGGTQENAKKCVLHFQSPLALFTVRDLLELWAGDLVLGLLWVCS
jgi:hypothetical protein